MSDDDWLERDIRSHHTVLLYVMVPTGPLMVLAGVLVFIHAILG